MPRYRAKTIKGIPYDLEENFTAFVPDTNGTDHFIGVSTTSGLIIPWHQIGTLAEVPEPQDSPDEEPTQQEGEGS